MINHKLWKIIRAIMVLLLTFGAICVTWLSDSGILCIGSGLSGIMAGLLIPYAIKFLVDIWDTTSWKETLRKLQRAHAIKKEDYVRISFAYLFRIMVDGKYFLVLNDRGTQKYQPVGGVYKMTHKEAEYIADKYGAINDDKIPVDEDSKLDYRLRVPSKYLRKFFKRFDSKAEREQITDVSREIKEELVSKGIINLNSIKYTYRGRHITDVYMSPHFKCYEILLADIVDIQLSEEQKTIFRNLKRDRNYMWASEEDVLSLGIQQGTNHLQEIIADHSQKILQVKEPELIRGKMFGNKYEVLI